MDNEQYIYQHIIQYDVYLITYIIIGQINNFPILYDKHLIFIMAVLYFLMHEAMA